ncbi:MAG: ABC transporter permease [Anditalea sp.]
MWKNYLKIAYRNLLKNKIFSLINILGLAIGMAACLLILQYVNFELSYDQFHEKADRIYRVRHDRYIDGELQYQKAQSFIPTGEAMEHEFPEVKEYTTLFRIAEQSDIIMTYQQENGDAINFTEKEVYHAKGNLLDIFSLTITEGQKDIKSLAPKTVLISTSAAKKYFGEASPINKTLSHNYADGYKIVGVFEDLPKNSHLKFDFLFAWMSLSGDEGEDNQNWRWDGFYTYLLLNPGADVKALEEKFSDLIRKYQAGGASGNVSSKFALQPLTAIHLYSNLIGEAEPNGEAKIVYTLLALALFILTIAWINYVNLSTTRSLDRVKEIGVRKVVGSGKVEIIKQFLVESMLVNLLALAAALTIIQILYTSFAEFTGVDMSLTLLQKPEFWMGVILLLFVGSFAAGLYPAFVISSFEPIKALKGKFYETRKSTSFWNLRHALVIFQFTISISLIAASLIVNKQLSYMKTRSLGINIDHTLVVNTHATGTDSLFTKNLSVLRDRLNSLSTIKGVVASYNIPGKEHLSNFPNFRHSKNPEELVLLYFTRIDYNFIPAFNVDLVAGRNFSEGIDDQYTMIMNVEAIHALGFEDPQEAIGYEVTWGNEHIGKAEIVGVVDFRSTSFNHQNYPVAYTSTFFPFKYLSIRFDKINGENARQNIALVENNWEAIFPEIPFEYFFLDDFFNSQYQEEQKFSQLLGIFTLLAIIVACLGLYAIASLTVLQRTKEVGVRKIMGASLKSLLLLLSKNFLLLVLIAGGISLPIMQFVVDRWMENYPHRAEISWWTFLLPIALILVITALTIGYQIIKASLVNPSKLLKYE